MVRGGRGLLALKRQLPAKCGFPSIHVCSRPLLSDSSNIRPCYVAETFGGALAKFQCRGSVYIGGCMYHFILICLWSSGYMIAWGRVRCVEVTNIFILPISLSLNVYYTEAFWWRSGGIPAFVPWYGSRWEGYVSYFTFSPETLRDYGMVFALSKQTYFYFECIQSVVFEISSYYNSFSLLISKKTNKN